MELFSCRKTDRLCNDNSHFSQCYEHINTAQVLCAGGNEQCLIFVSHLRHHRILVQV